ncbi:MAG: DapH/DapD/GlmU-related protein [Casimicrobiaceae bacterium]
MRKITSAQIVVFFLLFGSILFLGIGTAYGLLRTLPLGDFRGVTVVGGAVVLVYLYGFAVYRLYLWIMPLREGDLVEGSREEFAAQVNILFYLMLFNSLIRTHFLPVPVMRLVYQALGTRMGENTYSAGTLLDPPLTEFGANCIVGHDAVLICHVIEGTRFALSRIRVGDNVTIGASAVIMCGVSIGDGAIVSASAVVPKDTQIGPGEVWGGVPAKRLR